MRRCGSSRDPLKIGTQGSPAPQMARVLPIAAQQTGTLSDAQISICLQSAPAWRASPDVPCRHSWRHCAGIHGDMLSRHLPVHHRGKQRQPATTPWRPLSRAGLGRRSCRRQSPGSGARPPRPRRPTAPPAPRTTQAFAERSSRRSREPRGHGRASRSPDA